MSIDSKIVVVSADLLAIGKTITQALRDYWADQVRKELSKHGGLYTNPYQLQEAFPDLWNFLSVSSADFDVFHILFGVGEARRIFVCSTSDERDFTKPGVVTTALILGAWGKHGEIINVMLKALADAGYECWYLYNDATEDYRKYIKA